MAGEESFPSGLPFTRVQGEPDRLHMHRREYQSCWKTRLIALGLNDPHPSDVLVVYEALSPTYSRTGLTSAVREAIRSRFISPQMTDASDLGSYHVWIDG